jgi:murein DD-endopeptidase MepM/ murein hydrolase activator NlpD
MVSGPSETSSALNPWSKDDGKGAPVLAVADGRVVAARDGIPEPVAGASRPRTLTDAAGNYIALDIGQGRFAMYEHLAPGLAVAVGQQVLRGDVIATLGSTGQASRPHLHFHVSDAPSPIAAEGQPFEMNGWRQIGRHASIQAFDRGDPWMGSILSSADQSEQGFPGPNAVLMFD